MIMKGGWFAQTLLEVPSGSLKHHVHDSKLDAHRSTPFLLSDIEQTPLPQDGTGVNRRAKTGLVVIAGFFEVLGTFYPHRTVVASRE